MKLHLTENTFRDAVNYTAEKLNITPEYVEKDYWVTFALYTIFNDEIGKDVVFKGGTSLAKCYKWIERFSEDIDLVILRREGDSDNRLKSKLKSISSLVENTLPEINVEGITREKGMIRKTAHSYQKGFTNNYGQVRDVIVLESTWLGNSEPYTTGKVNSLIAENLLANQQDNFISEFELQSFDVQVLEPSRTLCEKIMSLVRFSYDAQPIEALRNKIRHTYDLYCLLQQPEIINFFESPNFDVLLKRVIEEDKESFKNNSDWLQFHPAEALIFCDTENIWNELKGTYNSIFKNLVFGKLPKEEEIKQVLIKLEKRLESVT